MALGGDLFLSSKIEAAENEGNLWFWLVDWFWFNHGFRLNTITLVESQN